MSGEPWRALAWTAAGTLTLSLDGHAVGELTLDGFGASWPVPEEQPAKP